MQMRHWDRRHYVFRLLLLQLSVLRRAAQRLVFWKDIFIPQQPIMVGFGAGGGESASLGVEIARAGALGVGCVCGGEWEGDEVVVEEGERVGLRVDAGETCRAGEGGRAAAVRSCCCCGCVFLVGVVVEVVPELVAPS
jgi:hypothetical protein